MNSHLQDTKQVRQFKSQQQRLKMKKSFTLPLAGAIGKSQSDIIFSHYVFGLKKHSPQGHREIHERVVKRFIARSHGSGVINSHAYYRRVSPG